MGNPHQWLRARRWRSGSFCKLTPSSILTIPSRLHEPAFKVTFDVENTGSVPGTEVRSFVFDLRHFMDLLADPAVVHPPPY